MSTTVRKGFVDVNLDCATTAGKERRIPKLNEIMSREMNNIIDTFFYAAIDRKSPDFGVAG
jgi:hypothetical protein